jgi:hypothetical protein
MLTIGVATICLALLGLRLPAEEQPKQARPKPKPLCSDIRVTLNVQKSDTGVVVLTGQVCNQGPGNYAYAAAPFDAYFMVYTWHPPKTPAQEGDIKFYAHTDLGTTLKTKECKSFRHQYQIEKFSRWGHFPASNLERLAWKQFVAKVERKNGPGFSACEAADITKTAASLDVPYMEKIN